MGILLRLRSSNKLAKHVYLRMKAEAVIERWPNGTYSVYSNDDIFGIVFFATGNTPDKAKDSFLKCYEELCQEGLALNGLDIQFCSDLER